MSYRGLRDADPCENMPWYERWFTPNCEVARVRAADAPAVATSPFTGVAVGSHSFLCSADPIFPFYKCASWATAQGLTDAMNFPLRVNVMGESRNLSPGGISPDGTVETSSTRDEAIINAITGRPETALSPWWYIGGVAAVAALYMVMR